MIWVKTKKRATKMVKKVAKKRTKKQTTKKENPTFVVSSEIEYKIMYLSDEGHLEEPREYRWGHNSPIFDSKYPSLEEAEKAVREHIENYVNNDRRFFGYGLCQEFVVLPCVVARAEKVKEEE